MREKSIPGVVAGVWIPGQGEWVAAVGEADITTGEPIETGDKVRIASNTKTFVATVVLQLVDEGKLSLEDTLDSYITGFTYGDEITIRQLLNMTAGIFNFTEDKDFAAEFTADPLMDFTPRDGLDIALSHPPDFPPGEGWHYSDTNYEILGLIAEEVAGGTIEEEIRRRIIEPLGLADTSFPTTPDMPAGSARGYVLGEKGDFEDYTGTNPAVSWAGGAMISNLYDMRDWSKSLANGDLLSSETQEERLEWVAMPGAERVDGKYGLGIFSIAGFIGHNGAIFGYNSIALYLPDEEATIVVMANKSTNDSDETMKIFLDLAELLFPERFDQGS